MLRGAEPPLPLGVHADDRVGALLQVGLADVDGDDGGDVRVGRFVQDLALVGEDRRALLGEGQHPQEGAERLRLDRDAAEARGRSEPLLERVGRLRRVGLGEPRMRHGIGGGRRSDRRGWFGRRGRCGRRHGIGHGARAGQRSEEQRHEDRAHGCRTHRAEHRIPPLSVRRTSCPKIGGDRTLPPVPLRILLLAAVLALLGCHSSADAAPSSSTPSGRFDDCGADQLRTRGVIECPPSHRPTMESAWISSWSLRSGDGRRCRSSVRR